MMMGPIMLEVFDASPIGVPYPLEGGLPVSSMISEACIELIGGLLEAGELRLKLGELGLLFIEALFRVVIHRLEIVLARLDAGAGAHDDLLEARLDLVELVPHDLKRLAMLLQLGGDAGEELRHAGRRGSAITAAGVGHCCREGREEPAEQCNGCTN